MKSIAYHLRQDGKYFRVVVHLYAMGDDDLSSEAEVSAFIINTDSQDIKLAKEIIDAWLAMRIALIPNYQDYSMDYLIKYALSHLPYKFMVPLPLESYELIHNELGNYTVDTLQEYIDSLDIPTLQSEIKYSFNQQFCRVRYGGQYNSRAGLPELWFRISSVGYNWANTIYEFVTNFKHTHEVLEVTICRDAESDNTEDEVFYKAKDGVLYFHMPLEEYLLEEHEHSVVFASVNSGVYHYIKNSLNCGQTLSDVLADLRYVGIDFNTNLVWDRLVSQERRKCQRVQT